jgi:hypothetical protein
MGRSIGIIKKIPRGYYFFGIFTFLFVGLMVFVEIKNGKFWTNDLRVYTAATRHFFQGGSPYKIPYGLGSGYFKYAPTTIYFFATISFLQFIWAQLLHTFVLVLSLVVSVSLLHRHFISGNERRRIGLLYLFFVFIAVHLVREIHLGNVNLILMLLFVAGLIAYKKGKENLLVLFWSFMILLKPIVIFVVLPMAFVMMWKPLFKMALIGILFFLIPFIHLGSNGFKLWQGWITALSGHEDTYISMNCLRYLSGYYLKTDSAWIPSLIGLGMILVLMVLDRMKRSADKTYFSSWSSILLAFTPNFFVTDTEHFLLSLPMIIMLVSEILRSKRKWLWFSFTVLMIGYSTQSNDLWGKALSAQISELGVLGLSNLGLIALFIFVRFKHGSVKHLPVN